MNGPVILDPNENPLPPLERRRNAQTGATAAGVRALGTQLISFYFRAPVKAFLRTRVDYMATARVINPAIQAKEAWSLRISTPGLLAYAVRTQGWGFLFRQVFPPLIANVSIGAVLYTTYLTVLGTLHAPSREPVKRIYPPPDVLKCFTSGAIAGAVQCCVAAPIDALQVRYDAREMHNGGKGSMVSYAREKLKDIGMRGVLAGFSLSLVRETLGYGMFFMTFEYVKAQAFYEFVTLYYGGLSSSLHLYRQGPRTRDNLPTIRPHYALEPSFLLLAGISATVAQQAISYPLGKISDLHFRDLESIDERLGKVGNRKADFAKVYAEAYRRTFEQVSISAGQEGWLRWLYRGFIWSTIRQAPSTSAGLVIFELIRKRFADESDAVRIRKDGYEILLQ